MAENRVFACSWDLRDGVYHTWVRAVPQIAAHGESFAEADERLYQAIMRATGDGENSREYSPLPPRPRAGGLLEVLRFLSPVSHAVVMTPARELYASVCPQCGYRDGPRTATPLAVREVPANVDAFRAGLGRPPGASGRVLCVSSEFLELMGDAARSGFVWAELEHPPRSRRRFFELVSAPVSARFIALSGAAFDPPWRCDTCGLQSPPFHHVEPGEPMRYVVFGQHEVLDETAWHAVEILRAPYLLATREVWGGLSRKKGVRGIQSYDVGVIGPELVDPNPRVVLRSRWPTGSGGK